MSKRKHTVVVCRHSRHSKNNRYGTPNMVVLHAITDVPYDVTMSEIKSLMMKNGIRVSDEKHIIKWKSRFSKKVREWANDIENRLGAFKPIYYDELRNHSIQQQFRYANFDQK